MDEQTAGRSSNDLAGASGGSAGSGGGAVGNAAGGAVAGKMFDAKHVWGRGLRGCLPDVPDARDVMYQPTAEQLASLPPSVDLRPQCPPIYDQGNLESCTSHAFAAAVEYNQMRAGLHRFTPSRLFIYYNERQMEGEQRNDNGARIRDGIKTLVRLGAPPEETWPYVEAAVNHEPPATAFSAAKLDLVTGYTRVPQQLEPMKAALAEGFPIVFCIRTFPSIDHTWETGFIPLPQPGEQNDGGHCVMLVGYDDARGVFLVRNSWGATWGDGGYGTIPYAYVTTDGLASDFWTIHTVKQTQAKPRFSAFDAAGEGAAAQ